ncbi:MarR family winged helix-turn-helix transcriptional regulator [Fusobacterium sp.]|uniref:MarR family winged helix-turn-helix transcriptional regulator n=1 Tax=Fusobacterium sp. TaxID=68766 RepID=UPI0029042002|nr:MarR family transcriptional regulator [Fusobacterium sp.]MDU1911126.1 MarR family transcriptional regulator [Fusobacterium sp.]
MKTVEIIGLISNIREKSAQFINNQLREKGIEGLINSHGTILSILYEHEGQITMNEIGKIIGKKKSTLTDLIKKLVELGYITRKKSEKDSRVVEISLTDKGWQFKSLFKEISDNLLEETYKDFTEEEKEMLILLLNKIRKNYQD